MASQMVVHRELQGTMHTKCKFDVSSRSVALKRVAKRKVLLSESSAAGEQPSFSETGSQDWLPFFFCAMRGRKVTYYLVTH